NAVDGSRSMSVSPIGERLPSYRSGSIIRTVNRTPCYPTPGHTWPAERHRERMKYVIFSQNHWNSPLKYQRHRLAEFLAERSDTERVVFASQISVRSLASLEIIVRLLKLPFRRLTGRS